MSGINNEGDSLVAICRVGIPPTSTFGVDFL